MTVDQRGAHGEPLRKADHRVVHREIAMRMVLTDNLADRPGRLLVRTVGVDAALVHGVEDATVDGLQAVTHVGQGTSGDDRHRVFDEALTHLVAELADLQRTAVDVFAGVFTAVDVAKALLELALVLFLLVALVLDVDVGALVVAFGAGEQAPQILGQPLRFRRLRRVVHIVCHVLPPGFVVVVQSDYGDGYVIRPRCLASIDGSKWTRPRMTH